MGDFPPNTTGGPGKSGWNVSGDGDARRGEADDEAGMMEGVHPGLATYNSQRSVATGGAPGGGAGGRMGPVGLEEYARMLEQMQQVHIFTRSSYLCVIGWSVRL